MIGTPAPRDDPFGARAFRVPNEINPPIRGLDPILAGATKSKNEEATR
ncbi:hypothetical protein [Acrocarpospora macrocephala]|nr:hypothetical protein [Acrocarpospora macrocephala]